MATYVLLHGSYQGGWIWKPVDKLLTAADHVVYRPTLDGCAERKGGVRPVARRADVAFWPERDVRAPILMSANQFAAAAEYRA